MLSALNVLIVLNLLSCFHPQLEAIEEVTGGGGLEVYKQAAHSPAEGLGSGGSFGVALGVVESLPVPADPWRTGTLGAFQVEDTAR